MYVYDFNNNEKKYCRNGQKERENGEIEKR